jgi:hypothetical protein
MKDPFDDFDKLWDEQYAETIRQYELRITEGHAAWSKLYNRNDITRDEWKTLYELGLLPNQTK